MSVRGAALPLLSDPALLLWERAGHAVAETQALGGSFLFSGAAITVKGAAALPQSLRAELEALSDSDVLRRFLHGGCDPDQAAIDFLRDLQVTPVVVETHADVSAAIAQLRRDIAEYDGHLGLDIETYPEPGQGEPRPPIRLNQDGTVAEKQPKWKNPAGLDPHRAKIACLQIYGGGRSCFVFRGAALARVLGLRWLRRQELLVTTLALISALSPTTPAGCRAMR